MKTILRIFSLLALLVPPISLAGQCQPSANIEDPAQFVWTNEGDHFSGTMEISERTFVIGG